MSQIDRFKNSSTGISGPATSHAAITPSDNDDIPVRPRSIYCNGAGTAVIRDATGTDISYDLTAGQILPFRGVRILATGTTATVVGWW